MTEQQTPDREKKIAEIREALEKATPGRWIYDETVGDVYSEKTDEIICCADVNDAHLIANAPEWLRFLISEIEQLKENNDKLMAWAKNALVGAKHEACKYTEDDPDTTWHCCNWSEVVEEAERIGVTVE